MTLTQFLLALVVSALCLVLLALLWLIRALKDAVQRFGAVSLTPPLTLTLGPTTTTIDKGEQLRREREEALKPVRDPSPMVADRVEVIRYE